MACSNPNCRTNNHLGACRAGEVQAPLPIEAGILRPVDRVLPDYRQAAPDYRQVDPVLAENQRLKQHARDLGQQLSETMDQLNKERRQRRQVEQALSQQESTPVAQQPCPPCNCPDCAPCPACPAPAPCPSCGSPSQNMPVMGEASVVGDYVGQQVGPVLTSDTPVPAVTGPDFQGRSGDAQPFVPGAQNGPTPYQQTGDAATPYQQTPNTGTPYQTSPDAPPADTSGVSGHVLLAAAQDGSQSYAIAPVPAAKAAATPYPNGGGRLQAPPIEPILRVQQSALMNALHARAPQQAASIQGVCKSCKAPVAISAPQAAVGAYSCTTCGYAHVGAPRFVPSPKCDDSRATAAVRQYRQKLLSLPAVKDRLARLGLSAADIAYCLSR